jgi:multidrug resistance efflux pump
MTHIPDKPSGPGKRRVFGWVLKLGIPAVIIAAALYFLSVQGTTSDRAVTFAARKGDLRVTVSEGGSVEARESQVIKCEVKGDTKILSIVEEGYQVTEQDVEQGKVLVTLDDTDLQQRKTQQEIQFHSSQASYTDARESYEIQVKQNESDVKSAELKVKFARMDFEKYLGAEVANTILDKAGLSEIDFGVPLNHEAVDIELEVEEPLEEEVEEGKSAAEPSEDAEDLAEVEEDGGIMMESAALAPTPTVDFTEYAAEEKLGDGEAREKLRKLQSERLLAEEELKLEETNLEGTERLAEKGFVTQQELERDTMALARKRNSYEASRIAEDMFIKYEFPKESEKLFSDYEEAVRALERTRKQAVAKLAQAEARMKSAQAQYELQAKERREILKEIENCIIEAELPGLVVYATDNRRWGRGEPIEEGADVRYGQEIITIPDMTAMAVEIKVHESAVKKVETGQRCIIHVDAYPGRPLEGEVQRVSVVPDSTRSWMNPDLKVYPTMVAIEGVHEWLKPGMSAEVEVFVGELEDVTYVPLQAVNSEENDRVVYVASLGAPERRVVKTGDFNDEYIEIQKGVSPGERVLLAAPEGAEKRQVPSVEEGPDDEQQEETPDEQPQVVEAAERE